jgi:hypothetical protein
MVQATQNSGFTEQVSTRQYKGLYAILLACCCSATAFFSRAVHLAHNYQRFQLLTPHLRLINVAVWVVAQCLATSERLPMY